MHEPSMWEDVNTFDLSLHIWNTETSFCFCFCWYSLHTRNIRLLFLSEAKRDWISSANCRLMQKNLCNNGMLPNIPVPWISPLVQVGRRVEIIPYPIYMPAHRTGESRSSRRMNNLEAYQIYWTMAVSMSRLVTTTIKALESLASIFFSASSPFLMWRIYRLQPSRFRSTGHGAIHVKTTPFLKVPIPDIQTSICVPGTRYFGGFKPAPTPGTC